jgi:tight adherence protein C
LGKTNPAVILVIMALGYILPDIWLNKKIGRRKQEIAKVLPETVDLLGLCVEAGLDFTSAVEWIVRKGLITTINPMIEELIFVVEEIKWGKPRSQSLKDMAKRLNIPEVNSFVQTLVQAERMGTPVSDAFNILSEDARAQRFNQGERFALKAPIKILIPLIFCILPVIGIIIGGPIFLQFSQGKMFSGF